MDQLYDFSQLKKHLISKGYIIGNREAYVPIRPIDITEKDLVNGRYRIEANGIFLIDEKGEEHRGFMYKRQYFLAKYGKPRYHVCRCKTVEEFLSSGRFYQQYRWSNSEPVLVVDRTDNDIDKEIDELPLCKNCLAILLKNGEEYPETTADFVEKLKEAGEVCEEVEVDYFGYTREWERISQLYRKELDYTCERCNTKVEIFDRRFLHVHHRNGDKTNNEVRNLECLCIDCHSKVDDLHRTNFSGENKQIEIKSFVKKYRECEVTL